MNLLHYNLCTPPIYFGHFCDHFQVRVVSMKMTTKGDRNILAVYYDYNIMNSYIFIFAG